MKQSTIKFLSLILKENVSSLLETGSSLIGSVEEWVNNNALTIEDEIETSTVPKAPEPTTIKVDKDKFRRLRYAYADWLSAHEFLDRCCVPDCVPSTDANYTLTGRIVELVNMAQKGIVSRELSEMLEYISTLNANEK